jgi:hypothetical protein
MKTLVNINAVILRMRRYESVWTYAVEGSRHVDTRVLAVVLSTFTLINIFACRVIRTKMIAFFTCAVVRSVGVHTVVRTQVTSEVAFINIETGESISCVLIAIKAITVVSAIGVDTLVFAVVGCIRRTLINIFTGSRRGSIQSTWTDAAKSSRNVNTLM